MMWYYILSIHALFCLYLSTLLIVSPIGESSVLTPGKSIGLGETIVSDGGNFAFGFFSPGNSSNSYIGIWYNTIPEQTVIWVANRESPIPMSSNSTAVFTFSRDGNLVLLNGNREVIWSSNVTVDDSNLNSTMGLLLETGNLVLRSGGSKEIVLWQSFDSPTDTLMPGMKRRFDQVKGGQKEILISWADDEDPQPGMFSVGMDPQERAQFFIWKQNDPYWRSNINVFSGFHSLLRYDSAIRFAPYLTFVEETDGLYVVFGVSDNSVKLRLTITSKGRGQMLLWPQNGNTWQVLTEVPRSECDFYGTCGPLASCEQNSAPALCSCIPGSEPNRKKDWEMGNWSGGCVRTQFGCSGDDRFQVIERVKLPDFSFSLGNMSALDCELACRRNCSCTAYAHAVSDSTGNCLNWFGDFVDLVHNDVLGRDLYVRLHGSKMGDNVETRNSTRKKSRSIPISAATASVGLLLIILCSYVLWRRNLRMKGRMRRNKQGVSSISITDGVEERGPELVSYSLLTILASTNDFSEANKLGEGGFGPVYKGSLPEFHEVAIKRLSKKSLQGTEEFMNELKLIAKLQHKNLVRILGCCFEGGEKILIYEYMPNRSLDTFMFDPMERTKLDWSKRFQIIEGISQGLLYLHKYSRLKVIHRDLKASNILLDEAMSPKISDFGMARTFNINQTEANTNRVMGTYGYMSPEYALYGKFSEKSDVFSFGVLLLEIVSGRKNTDFHRTIFFTLLGWAWENWEAGKGEELIDPLIRESCEIQEAMKCIIVGLLCVQEAPSNRPSMSTLVSMLSNDIASLPSPKQPAFSTRKTFDTIGSSSSKKCNKFSNNEVTITMLEAR